MFLPSTFCISLLTIMPGANTDSEPLDFLIHCSHPPPCQPHTHPSLVLERNVGFRVVQNWVPNSLLPGSVALGSFTSLSHLHICETRKGCPDCVRSRADAPWGLSASLLLLIAGGSREGACLVLLLSPS